MTNSKRNCVWLLVVAAMAWESYDWIFRSDGPAYFAKDWRRVAFVIGLSIVGGLVVFGFMRLPAEIRRRAAVVLFGSGAVLAFAGCLYFALLVFLLRKDFVTDPGSLIFVEIPVSFCAILSGLCVWFWNYFRKRNRQDKPNL